MFGSRRAEGKGDLRSERSVAIARRGMVATSQTLASAAGLAVLRDGGNAVDAAIAAVAMQGVVEPYSTGIGGDCFALVWMAGERRLHGYNGSGRSAADVDLDEALRRGAKPGEPLQGALSITVPGAVDAWCALLDRFGTRSLAEVLAPAIEYAEAGFPVSEVIALEWGLVVRSGFLQNDAARRCFMPGGEPPAVGQVVRLPDLARSLRALAAGGRDAFYRGEIAARIAACVAEAGGWLAAGDLARHRGAWVEPLSVGYRGHRVCELPPNGQGLTALVALGILAEHDVASLAPGSAEALHLEIEAIKLALADRDRWVADPDVAPVPVGELLDPAYLRARAALIDPRRASKSPGPGLDDVAFAAGRPRDTVYLTTADGNGNVVSLINSLFGPFGCGIVAGDTGIALHNRGAGFSLERGHPNCLAPGKRPLHTIIPAMLFDGDVPRVSFGVMGGHIQAQGHVHLVTGLLDHGLNVQEAIDQPRFHVLDGTRVCLERGVPESTARGLAERGHEIADPFLALLRGGFGGGQAIAIDPRTGAFWGASDRRKDGCAAGW